MLKLYCQKCGSLNAYISDKPNFCQKCGNSFIEGLDETLAQEQDSEEQVSIPDGIKELDVEIDASPYRGEKLSDLVGTSDGKAYDGVERPADEYTMDDFKREAGGNNKKNEEKPET